MEVSICRKQVHGGPRCQLILWNWSQNVWTPKLCFKDFISFLWFSLIWINRYQECFSTSEIRWRRRFPAAMKTIVGVISDRERLKKSSVPFCWSGGREGWRVRKAWDQFEGSHQERPGAGSGCRLAELPGCPAIAAPKWPHPIKAAV